MTQHEDYASEWWGWLIYPFEILSDEIETFAQRIRWAEWPSAPGRACQRFVVTMRAREADRAGRKRNASK